MEKAVRDYLGQFTIGDRLVYKNLAMYPLLSSYTGSLDYLTLDEALSEHLIEVSEVSAGGTVTEIKLTNSSPRRVLILDGEELVGAKQNRIVNTTILKDADTTIIIPVICVEQGRWDYRSQRFYSEERIMSYDLRAKKAAQVYASLRRSGKFQSDQGAIWDEILDKAMRMHAPSPSMAMSMMYEKEDSSIKEYLSQFHPVDMQTGAVFMINGRIAGLEGFARPDTFSKVFGKLVRSYALDAIDWFDPEKEPVTQDDAVSGFLADAQAATVEPHSAVALGIDCRLRSNKVIGFALVFDGQVLHLSIFAPANGAKQTGETSRMGRFSARRRNRS